MPTGMLNGKLILRKLAEMHENAQMAMLTLPVIRLSLAPRISSLLFRYPRLLDLIADNPCIFNPGNTKRN